MWRPVTLSGNRSSLMATSGQDRWPSNTELGLQTSLTIHRFTAGGLFGPLVLYFLRLSSFSNFFISALS